jgi:transcriptional regulator with XRE-family HTH domain
MILKLPETLRALMKRHRINELQLARDTGIHQPVINRILSGKTANPQIRTLIPLADRFNISLECLAGIDESASKQREHLFTAPDKARYLIPHITHAQLWDYCQRPTSQDEHIDINKKISVNFNPGPLGFAFSVFDDSMAPVFPKNSVIVIDPTLEPIEGDYVLVSCRKKKAITFKQYLVDGTQGYLKSTNLDFPIQPLRKQHSILGVMIQALIKRQSQAEHRSH